MFFISDTPIFGIRSIFRRALARPKSCQKTATYRIPGFFQLAVMVPIGGAIQISTLLRTAGAFGTRIVPDRAPMARAPWPLGLSTARSRRNAACRFSYVTTMSTKPLGCRRRRCSARASSAKMKLRRHYAAAWREAAQCHGRPDVGFPMLEGAAC